APDAGGEPLAGTVIARDPALSDQSRNLRYRAQLAATPLLPVRAVVTVRVPVAAEARIQVPAQAVLRDEIGSYVYLLDPDGDAYRARRRGVGLGGSNGDTVTAEAGLAPGGRLAAHRALQLGQGLRAVAR